MTKDSARVVAQKIDELAGIFSAHHILAVRPGRDNEDVHFVVQVTGFKNVPDTEDTTYKKRQDPEYLYEKSAIVDSVKFLAIGTAENMKEEFKG